MKAILLILALCTSQAAGAQTQLTFKERFDSATFLEAVEILVRENFDTGATIMEVFIPSSPKLPITDDAREKMSVIFGKGAISWAQEYYKTHDKFTLHYRSIDGDGRKSLQEMVASEQYAKELTGTALQDELTNIRRYVGQDLAELPTKIGVVQFPKNKDGVEITWYLCFRLVEKMWRWEYSFAKFTFS